MKNWYISTTVGSLALALASAANAADLDTGWSLKTEPMVSIDYEGMISPVHSTPYVLLAHKDKPYEPDFLTWDYIKFQIESGQYGKYGEKVIREACRAMVEERPELARDESIPTATIPREDYTCG